MKAKKRLSEPLTAYLMVLPAILVIFTIALWPVMRSFWYSMFDLRLNHPAKNAVHLEYQLDMERFVDTQFYIENAFRELEAVKDGKDRDKIYGIRRELDSLKKDMMKIQGVSERYEPVEKC